MADYTQRSIHTVMHKTLREYKPPEIVLCKFTCVMPQIVQFWATDHNASVTHRCSLEKDHKGSCECLCKFQFQGYNQ